MLRIVLEVADEDLGDAEALALLGQMGPEMWLTGAGLGIQVRLEVVEQDGSPPETP
jgi:hypothetical protein